MVRLRRVLWEDCLVGCVGMAGMPYPPNLCISVKSVGEFCSVGAAGTAAPPVVQMQKVH